MYGKRLREEGIDKFMCRYGTGREEIVTSITCGTSAVNIISLSSDETNLAELAILYERSIHSIGKHYYRIIYRNNNYHIYIYICIYIYMYIYMQRNVANLPSKAVYETVSQVNL